MIECTCKAADMPFGRCCKAVPDDATWRGAANWLRNNYQDHPNIASLCDAMSALSPRPAPVAQPLTDKQVDEAFWTDCGATVGDSPRLIFAEGVRYAERAHKIGGPL